MQVEHGRASEVAFLSLKSQRHRSGHDNWFMFLLQDASKSSWFILAPWVWSRSTMGSKGCKLKLAQIMAGHSLGIRVQQEALCGRGVGVLWRIYRYHSQVWPLSSEMDAVWGGNSGRKPGSMWVWFLPQGKSGIVYSSSRKIVGSPLGLGHLFLTNRLFTEKHDFCWPENMPEFNPHLQSCLSCWVFFFPQGQVQINLFPQG